MYTGFSIRNNRIYTEKRETQFSVNDEHICVQSDQPTGCYLAEGLSREVKHICGPDGYTKFYVQCEHIYSPSTHLPWFDLCDGPV